MMSAPNQTEEDNQNILELGDIITVKSTVFGSLTGKIIYRDEKLIRVVSINASDRATDLVLNVMDGDFDTSTGITECTIHSKRDDPHFSLQIGASQGERLEFLSNAGQQVAESGIIAEIIADDENDAVVLVDGRRIDFAFIGPPMPIQVVAINAVIEELANEGAEANDEFPAYDLDLLDGLIPAAMVEEISTAERTYPEGIQREEMYTDLLKSYSEAKRKNPNLLRKLARETELLIALKNAVIVTNEKGEPQPFVKSADSLKDILTNLSASVSSILPVLAVKRILYTGAKDVGELTKDQSEQVELRDWLKSELANLELTNTYNAGNEARGQKSKPMYSYLYQILYNEGSVFLPNTSAVAGQEIQSDMEILRTVLPPKPIIGFAKLGEKAKTDSSFLASLKTRQYRVISSLKTAGGDLLAPSDPGTAVSYLLFPTHIGSSWRPNKFSGSLSEDIRAANLVGKLESIESLTNDKRLYNPNGIQIVKGNAVSLGLEPSDINISEWLAQNLKNSIHPSDLLASGSIGIYKVLDSIGLRSYEYTPDVSRVLWSGILKSQELYTKAFEELTASVASYLEKAQPYNLGDVISKDSTLYKDAVKIPEISQILAKFGTVHSDLLLAQAVMYTAEGTLARVLYFGAGHPDLDKVRKTYLSEVYREKTRFFLVNAELAKYKATPEINNCPHVHDMDVLRSVMKTDNSKFYTILQKVLNSYQGERSNNWINCKVCDAHLICIHEVMMLYELTHPGKASALHKELLLDYGGAAFSGRYVCRYCGVQIAEFEYDTSLEYDDSGKPLVGRNVLESGEKTVEDELGDILEISVKKEIVDFDNPIKASLYEVARMMTQSAGFNFNEESYKSIVEFTSNYIEHEMWPKDTYEMTIAKKKIKPTYESFVATNKIAITATYILCMIHTMNPVPELLYPFPGCPFKRGGYPIENDNPDNFGAMDYFVCVIANINRPNLAPWDISLWSKESSTDKRKTLVRGWIDSMLKGPVRILLGQARFTYTASIKDTYERASSNDKVPVYFRPTTNKNPALFDSEVMAHPDRVLQSAMGDDIRTIQPLIEERNRQLACNSVTNAHIVANESGLINPLSERSDSVCCFMPIQEVRNGAVSLFNPPAVEAEITVLREAEQVIQKRDPCMQSNGSHLYVHWSSPEAVPIIKMSPDASYFKLFMRTCFRGSRVGMKHEFGRRSDNFECRHCNFTIGVDPLTLMSDLNDEELYNNDSKRKGGPVTVVTDKAREALKVNGIVVDAAKFDELLTAVRSKKLVEPFVEKTPISSMEIFDHINRLVNTDCPFMTRRLEDWQQIVTIMSVERDAEPSEETRLISWAPFVSKYDSLRTGLLDILNGDQSRGTKPIPKIVEEIVKSIERITSEPKYQGPNEINKHFVVGLERISQNFSEMLYGSSWFGQSFIQGKKAQNLFYSGKRWFGKKISQKHSEKFEGMIENILGFTKDTTKKLGVEIRTYSSEITHKLSTYLGRILKFWSENMPSFSVFGVSNQELGYILRWLVFSSIETLLIRTSPIYASVPSEADKEKIHAILLDWVRKTFLEAKRQYDLFGLSETEIQLAILDAREKEKISIIKEIDDEKDPDLRAVTKIQQKLKIGRWAIGSGKNTSSYNAQFQDFLQEQRDRAGITDNSLMKVKEDALGFDMSQVENSAYDTAVNNDEDEGGAMEE